MNEESQNKILEKKIWNAPILISLNVKKTEGGPASDLTEDFQSGTINTQPS